MTFFSLLYESDGSKRAEDSKEWIAFKSRSLIKREQSYEYVGNKLVKVECKDDGRMYPTFYEHLHLDSIIEKIYKQETFIKMQKVLTHLFITKETIIYRQEIVKDLENPCCYSAFVIFRNQLQEIHQIVRYSEEVKEWVQKDSYYLKAIYAYCEAIRQLKSYYETHEMRSKGLEVLGKLLSNYVEGKLFREMEAQAIKLKEQFEKITYQLLIGEKQVGVKLGENSFNYTQSLAKLLDPSEEMSALFLTNLHSGVALNSLETQLLEMIRGQYDHLFRACHEFVDRNKAFIEGFIENIEDELLFYIEYIDYMNSLKKKGFIFCYPKISEARNIAIEGMYDLSLANQKSSANEVVANDLHMKNKEHGACITGANQGGKTTFIRGLGQVGYFTALGLPVAAKRAELPLYQRLYTHFAEPEDAHSSNGKLKEELIKLEATLKTANEKSVVLMNELFASTTMKDGHELGKETIKKLTDMGARVFCVTHIISLAQEDLGLISLVAEVNEEERSHRIVRKVVDGKVYTKSLIQKYHLSYEEVKERLIYEN